MKSLGKAYENNKIKDQKREVIIKTRKKHVLKMIILEHYPSRLASVKSLKIFFVKDADFLFC